MMNYVNVFHNIVLVHISAVFQIFFFVHLLKLASLHCADRGTSENIRLL
jgi:hypothetical protein